MIYLQQALKERLITGIQISQTLDCVLCRLLMSVEGFQLLREKFVTIDRLNQDPVICYSVLDALCSDLGLTLLREGFLTIETANQLGYNRLACLINNNGVNAFRRGFFTQPLPNYPLDDLLNLYRENIIELVDTQKEMFHNFESEHYFKTENLELTLLCTEKSMSALLQESFFSPSGASGAKHYFDRSLRY